MLDKACKPYPGGSGWRPACCFLDMRLGPLRGLQDHDLNKTIRHLEIAPGMVQLRMAI